MINFSTFAKMGQDSQTKHSYSTIKCPVFTIQCIWFKYGQCIYIQLLDLYDLCKWIVQVLNRISFSIQFLFKKTFREHKGANAIDCTYTKLSCLYACVLKVTYNSCLITFGFILTFIWGILNGVTAFLQAWCISPLLRVSLILVKGVMPLILDPLSLLLKAYADACRPGGGIGTAIGGAMQGVSSAVSRI